MADIENEQEFRFFMDTYGPESDKAKKNYISWLRYLSNEGINIDSHISDGSSIDSYLKETEANRSKYTDSSHYGDFKSAVNKYRQFIASPSYVPQEKNTTVTKREEFIKIPKPENVYNDYNDENEEYYNEGKAIQVLKNIYERDKDARRKCIEHYGHKCSACGLILSDMYGEIAEDFIHVHHIIELSSIKKEYVVDPIKDLRPLCPNCHAIIHRKSPALSIEALIDIISNKKNKTAAKPTPPAGSPAA